MTASGAELLAVESLHFSHAVKQGEQTVVGSFE
jgi:hypothetical protein